MNDSAIKKLSESDIVIPRTQEGFFPIISVKPGIIRCFLSDDSLTTKRMREATELLQHTRNKLEILSTTDNQVYTNILYRIDKLFNDCL